MRENVRIAVIARKGKCAIQHPGVETVYRKGRCIPCKKFCGSAPERRRRKRSADSPLSRNPCYCGWAYDGRKCRALQKKHPSLNKKNGWHKPWPSTETP